MKKIFLIALLLVATSLMYGQAIQNSLRIINELCVKYDPYIRIFSYDENTNRLKWVTKDGDITCDVNLNEVDATYNSQYETVQFKCKTEGAKCIASTYGGPTDISSVTVKNENAAKLIIAEINTIASGSKMQVSRGGAAVTERSSGNNSGFSSSSDLGTMLSTFLQLWVDKPKDVDSQMMKYISHEYLKVNNLDVNKYKVNNYTAAGFEIESIDKDNSTVIANVWGVDKKWNHRLSFKIINENGYLYFSPVRYSEYFYITPWTDVADKPVTSNGRASALNRLQGSTPVANEYSKVVEELMKVWMDKPSDKQEIMRRFISPAYIISNKIKIGDYKINYYSPTEYNIETSDISSGLVTVKIWGSAKVWIHRVVFKVVNENGLYYLYPSKINEGYIYPWDSAIERISE